MLELKTVRQTSALGWITEHHLRRLIAEGKCPGVYSGNRFLVNVGALQEQLDAESREGRRFADDVSRA